MMRHFVVEGIGMRHLIDYYYVLRKLHVQDTDGIDFDDTFRFLGMRKFASGVMWIEKEILGIDEKMLITKPSEKLGRIILHSIMEGGNFGHHRGVNSIRRKNVMKRGLIDAYRMIWILPVQLSEVVYRLMYKIGNVRSLKKAFC